VHYVIRWFRLQWNNVIAPLITDAVITGSVGDSTSQTKVASTALYVLMQRSIVPGCPLTEHGRNLVTNFIEYNKKCGRRVLPMRYAPRLPLMTGTALDHVTLRP